MTQASSPNGILTLRNWQRDCRIDLRGLRALVRFHLENHLKLTGYDIAIHLVSPGRMAAINLTHLHHDGPTDVITFDYSQPDRDELHGELLICPAVAMTQAKDYRTSWESEIVRYIIHGLLHLQGYDDLYAADRRAMKREENRRLKALIARHPARQLRFRTVSCKRPLE